MWRKLLGFVFTLRHREHAERFLPDEQTIRRLAAGRHRRVPHALSGEHLRAAMTYDGPTGMAPGERSLGHGPLPSPTGGEKAPTSGFARSLR